MYELQPEKENSVLVAVWGAPSNSVIIRGMEGWFYEFMQQLLLCLSLFIV